MLEDAAGIRRVVLACGRVDYPKTFLMKTTTDFIFPDAFKAEAEEYISYKRSLGFSFSIDDQRKLSYMLNYIYYFRLTKQYFINVLDYTQEQANTIFSEV